MSRLVLVNRWRMLVACALLAGSQGACRHEAPTATEALADLVDRADRLVVREWPQEDAPVLFESSRREDLDALRDALQVKLPEYETSCFCTGAPAIELYAGAERIAQVCNKHERAIHCELWSGDATLLDRERWLTWFDRRGMPEIRADADANLEMERADEADLARWTDAMPACVRPLWPDIQDSPEPDVTVVEEALERQYPDSWDRILALLAWYGSDSGPWNGYPAYEVFPARLLVRYTSHDVRFAIDVADLTPAQTEGLARLFAGPRPEEGRMGGVSILPAELKSSLLRYCLASDDEDKQAYGRSAFGDE